MWTQGATPHSLAVMDISSFRRKMAWLMEQKRVSNRALDVALRKKGFKVSRNKVGDFLNGNIEWDPTIGELEAMAEFFEIDVGTLLGADFAAARRTVQESRLIRYAEAVGFDLSLRLLYDAIPKPSGIDPRLIPDEDSDVRDG